MEASAFLQGVFRPKPEGDENERKAKHATNDEPGIGLVRNRIVPSIDLIQDKRKRGRGIPLITEKSREIPNSLANSNLAQALS